jgi:hypothetical protein
MFKNVHRVEGSCVFEGVTIEYAPLNEADDAVLASVDTVCGRGDVAQFRIGQPGQPDRARLNRVICGAVGWIESDLEFDARSPLLEGHGSWTTAMDLRAGNPIRTT